MRAAAEIVVDRPLQVVWTWASDPRNWENWLEGVQDVRLVGRLSEEGRIVSRYRHAGELQEFEYEIVKREPPRRQIIRAVSGPFAFESALALSEDPRGTRVHYTADAGADSAFTSFLFTAGGPLVRRSMRRHMESQLERLKTAIELTGVR
jgi:carbon monoxide dehydrogenase subunit G